MYRHLARGDRPQDGCKGLAGGSPPSGDHGVVGHCLHDGSMDTQDPVQQLRSKAAAMRPFAPEVANAYDDAANLVERHVQAQQDALVNLSDAARLSGYSPDTIRRHIEKGRIENHGGSHRPRIRRGDLPRKAGQGSAPQQPIPGPDLAAESLRRRGVLTIPEE